MRKSDGVRGYHERKSDRVRVNDEKDRWGEHSSSERVMG